MAIQVSTIQVRGKIGNAVGYKRSGARRSGANFARVYTDVVRDPQTASQLYQRAIAATVSKAYAAMSRICDHSFQGSAVGAESMQRFYSVNLNQLRRDVMADLSDPVTDPVDMVGCVVAPRSAFPTCYPFIVSEGTLTNTFLRVSSIDAQLCVLFPAALSATETVSAYVRRCGLVRGDIFTALGLGVLDPEGAFSSQYGQLASQPSTSFGFIRFKLKDAAFSDNSPVADAPVSQVFSIEYGGRATAFADDELPERAVFCDSITGGDDGFLGVIRSRRNSPLRSSCRLQGTLTDGTVSDESKYGIKSAYLLNAWLPEQDTLGQSSLILEGGSLNGRQTPRLVPVLNDLIGQYVDSKDAQQAGAFLASMSAGDRIGFLLSDSANTCYVDCRYNGSNYSMAILRCEGSKVNDFQCSFVDPKRVDSITCIDDWTEGLIALFCEAASISNYIETGSASYANVPSFCCVL